MSNYRNLDKVLKEIGVKSYYKIGEGKRASFFVTLSEYKGEMRIMFLTINERANWIGGKYSIPIDLADNLLTCLKHVIADSKKGEMINVK